MDWLRELLVFLCPFDRVEVLFSNSKKKKEKKGGGETRRQWYKELDWNYQAVSHMYWVYKSLGLSTAETCTVLWKNTGTVLSVLRYVHLEIHMHFPYSKTSISCRISLFQCVLSTIQFCLLVSWHWNNKKTTGKLTGSCLRICIPY